MSEIKKVFYNLFWQNQSCQNLFMLSKEELLETTTIGEGENAFSYSLPRITIPRWLGRPTHQLARICNPCTNDMKTKTK